MSSVLPDPDQYEALTPAQGSHVWRAAGDARILSASGYALVLQVAHPTVGAGVMEHSEFASDPWGRLLRTLDYVNGSIYGGPRMAGEIGRRVRTMHRKIKGVKPNGEPYHALEPGAYAWVHATLASAIVDGHRFLGSPMTLPQRQAFWDEWRTMGRLIGIRSSDLPADWAGFRSYFREMVASELQDTPMVHLVLDTLARPAAPPIPGLSPGAWGIARRPASAHLRLVTLGMLPAQLRERLGVSWARRDELAFRAVAALSRASRPLLIAPLRQFGPVYLRWRAEALARGDVAHGHAEPTVAGGSAAIAS